MLDKVLEMENDPTAPKNAIEPPEEDEAGGEGEAEEFEDDSFDDGDLPFEGEEFSFLNRQLDQLQSALDEIESRNAGIHKELLEILHSNREVRQTIKEEIVSKDGVSPSDSEANPPSGEKSIPSSSASGPSDSNKDDVNMTAHADLLSATSSIAHLINTVTQDIDKLSP